MATAGRFLPSPGIVDIRACLLGEGVDDPVTMVAILDCHKAEHRVPVTVSCEMLGVSTSWFYMWQDRPATPSERRRGRADRADPSVARGFRGRVGVAAGARRPARRGRGRHREDGGKTHAGGGIAGRCGRRRIRTTMPDRAAPPFPDLLERNLASGEPGTESVRARISGPRERGSPRWPPRDASALRAPGQGCGRAVGKVALRVRGEG